MKDFIIAFHYCVPEVHTTNWERNEFPRPCQPWVTSFVPDKDIPQSLYPFLFFSRRSGGGFVTNLLLAGHTIKTYGLGFHRLGRENYLSSTFILGVLCTAAAGEYSITCLCSHLRALFAVTSMFSILRLYMRGWSTVMDRKPCCFSKIQISPEVR